MRTFSTILIALFFAFTTSAQQAGLVVKTIKGKVINATTNEPVSYTNIGLEGTYHGTASDENGNFELKIPQEMASKNIYFSAVGFKNIQFPVQSLFDKEFNMIKMKAQTYGIDDVDIAAQNMVLIRILRMASEEIPYNFIKGPYNLTATYSSQKTVNDSTQEQSGDVLIYDFTGYSEVSKLNAYQSLKYSVKMADGENGYRFSTGTTNIDELLELDWARSASSVLNPAITGGLSLKLLEEPTIGGKAFWVISFKQKKPALAVSGDFYATNFEGEITIEKETYSVLEIEGKVESAKNNRQGRGLAVGATNSNYFENVSYNFSVSYKELRPAKIELNKLYTLNGAKISEHSVLEITNARSSNLTELDSRQYFTGE